MKFISTLLLSFIAALVTCTHVAAQQARVVSSLPEDVPAKTNEETKGGKLRSTSTSKNKNPINYFPEADLMTWKNSPDLNGNNTRSLKGGKKASKTSKSKNKLKYPKSSKTPKTSKSKNKHPKTSKGHKTKSPKSSKVPTGSSMNFHDHDFDTCGEGTMNKKDVNAIFTKISNNPNASSEQKAIWAAELEASGFVGMAKHEISQSDRYYHDVITADRIVQVMNAPGEYPGAEEDMRCGRFGPVTDGELCHDGSMRKKQRSQLLANGVVAPRDAKRKMITLPEEIGGEVVVYSVIRNGEELILNSDGRTVTYACAINSILASGWCVAFLANLLGVNDAAFAIKDTWIESFKAILFNNAGLQAMFETQVSVLKTGTVFLKAKAIAGFITKTITVSGINSILTILFNNLSELDAITIGLKIFSSLVALVSTGFIALIAQIVSLIISIVDEIPAFIDAGEACQTIGLPSQLDKFVFTPQMDSHGSDISHLVGGVEVYAQLCYADPNCRGFNSDGWLKHYILPQSQWTAPFNNDPTKGLYVKKV